MTEKDSRPNRDHSDKPIVPEDSAAVRNLLKTFGITTQIVGNFVPLDAVRMLLAEAMRLRRKSAEQSYSLDALQKATTRDGKTDLPNEHGLEEHLVNALARRRNQGPDKGRRRHAPSYPQATLVFIDFDDFGDFNNHYSHLAGDLALKHFARTMRGTYNKDGSGHTDDEKMILLPWKRDQDGFLRYDDFMGRLNNRGDEFAVIMFETTPEEATQIMQRAKEKFEKTHFTYREPLPGGSQRERELNFSFTFGVTPIHDNDTISALRERASNAMKSNKRIKNIDVLTGAYNHEAGMLQLEKYCSALNDETTPPINLFRVEVNGLRNLDEHRTDAALQYVADALKEAGNNTLLIRQQDDSFIVAINGTEKAQARALLKEKVRKINDGSYHVYLRDQEGKIAGSTEYCLGVTLTGTAVNKGDDVRLAVEHLKQLGTPEGMGFTTHSMIAPDYESMEPDEYPMQGPHITHNHRKNIKKRDGHADAERERKRGDDGEISLP